MLLNRLIDFFRTKNKPTNITNDWSPFILEISNLNIRDKKDKKDLLHNVNIKIPANSIVAIIGPSGSGKSTLIKCINRTSSSDNHEYSGEIKYCGVNILDKNYPEEYLRTQIGTVLQKPIMFPMSIRENVLLALKQKGIRSIEYLEDILKKSLEEANLWDEVSNRLNNYPEDILSIGQQQRLCIARAIALKPKVLLMDEPTSALDIKSVKKIETLIKNISKNKKTTILIISHSLAQVQRISDYTIFMKNGRVIEQGKTTDIFKSPKHEETDKFLNNPLR